ncbi:MAG: copper amine oxidase N-terminal domain-containing protein, partial [Firmicutes bacterium]|nr:copper amine oxidase N-terminal domain-containing protein [Bacillota bacterium]
MKKLFLTMLLLVVLTFGAAQTCLAANVPVYLDGERVTTGLERGGYTYLPLRSMFETVGGAVEWEEKTQTITAYLPDGGILTMQIGSKTPEDVREKENSIEHSRYELEQAAFISRGITYVPLRFITETLLQYDLDWRNNAVWLTSPKLKYTLSSGEVFKLDK